MKIQLSKSHKYDIFYFYSFINGIFKLLYIQNSKNNITFFKLKNMNTVVERNHE